MGLLEIVLVGIGLAMDAFAVSICKGLSIKKITLKNTLTISSYFSVFQAIMPLLGFLLGTTFSGIIEKVDHWVAFTLLSVIGLNMIKDSFEEEAEKTNDNIDAKTMLLLGLATSIDALAVGITFAFLKTNIVMSVSIIGIITFVLCVAGVKIGNKFGNKFQNKAGIAGGIILIFIGIKILLEHLSII